MFGQGTIIAVFLCYLAILFLVALWVERKSAAGVNIGDNPIIYALSFGVYLSTWTYYGSVGKAATSGMLFLAVYLGPTIVVFSWWILLRKMIRLKNSHKITSIADFISARYHKSQTVAAITTIIAIFGLVPYVALQLKAVISTYEIITISPEHSAWPADAELIIVLFMILFTIIFGVRRLDPTERHQGMIVALVLECVVKLIAFLAAGIFVTYFLFDGFGDILSQASRLPESGLHAGSQTSMAYYMTWTTYLILSMSAILFLPRQFHVAVIENFDENHIRTAMWLFPLYMFLINIFVFPIAMAGVLLGLPVSAADTYVLDIPLQAGRKWLSLLVFLGGFSAAMGMVMISSMTMSTMITNHLLLPVTDWFRSLGFLKRYLLQCRWAAVAGYIILSWLFASFVGESYMLVNIGMISFAAVLQFAPAMLGGIFWKKGNLYGALAGLLSGFALWFYTLLLPTFVRSGWLGDGLLTEGPFGISALKPESLLGMSTFDPLSHAVFWSIFCNSICYVLFSLLSRRSQKEQIAAEEFVDILHGPSAGPSAGHEEFIDIDQKIFEIESLLCQYFPREKAASLIRQSLTAMGLAEKKNISIVELVELHEEIERRLAGSIGATAAYHGLHKGLSYSAQEQEALSSTYAEILADLKLTPQDLKNKVDFYKERDALLTKQASELEEKVLELNREIEERQQAEQALRESEAKYHTLVDNINIGVFRVSPERGRFIQANPAMAKIFGYDSLDEFLEVSVADLYSDGSDRRILLEGVRRDGFVKDRELNMQKKDGTAIWCSVSAAATFNEQGNIEWIDGVMEDITNRKKLEQQLRHAQKMEAIGTLAGGIAHDFNNILTATMGYGNLLKMKIGADELLNNYVDQILASSEKAANLTQSLLAFSRKQIVDLKAVDLNEIVRGMEKLLRRLIGEDIEFHIITSEKKLTIMADKGQIEQILVNLSTNASDAMPGGGLFTLQTEYIELKNGSPGFPTHLTAGEYALITASDTGKGMDEQTRQRIFEPFFTTKEVGKGTGLGLSIVYGIIKQHHGDVHVYSEPGKGSSFKIYFPLIRSETEDLQQKKQKIMLGGSEKILIAEDSADVRKLMVTVLEQFGYTVIEAVDGEDAVKKFAENSEDIQLLILDVVMPKMNGREALDKIKKIREDIKVIFASGYTADIIQRKGILEGGAGFLPKPVLPHVLLSTIRETLDSGDKNKQ